MDRAGTPPGALGCRPWCGRSRLYHPTQDREPSRKSCPPPNACRYRYLYLWALYRCSMEDDVVAVPPSVLRGRCCSALHHPFFFDSFPRRAAIADLPVANSSSLTSTCCAGPRRRSGVSLRYPLDTSPLGCLRFTFALSTYGGRAQPSAQIRWVGRKSSDIETCDRFVTLSRNTPQQKAAL